MANGDSTRKSRAEHLPIPLSLGIWTKPAANEIPPGALTYAKDCLYKAGASGLRKREVHGDLDSSALSLTTHGITQFQTTDGDTDKLVIHAGTKIFTADTSTSPTFVEDDIRFTDVGPTTFVQYADRLYISDGTSNTRVMDPDGSIDRKAGIPSDKGIALAVTGTTGTAFTVNNGVHFTYRYFDSVNNVYSDVAETANGELLFASLIPVTSTVYDWIEIKGLPISAPADTEADELILYMTLDEINPTTFYPVKSLALDSVFTGLGDSIVQPTAAAITASSSVGFTNTNSAVDEDKNSAATSGTPSAVSGALNNTISTDWTGVPSGTVGDWILQVRYSVFSEFNTTQIDSLNFVWGDWNGVFLLKIEYSTDDFSTDTDMVSLVYDINAQLTALTANIVQTTVTSTISSINPNTVKIRASIARQSGTEGVGPNFKIHDIRLIRASTGDGSILVAEFPLTTARPNINAAIVGQFQPPPLRIFHNIIFEGHVLGKSDTNGLFLAYSRTDEPEHWSTDPLLSAFPYLIPFKEKEADDLVGADKVANQLVVFATDSVWRINHLPVLSDPSGALSELFAEARSIVKRRLTDTVGCVGERAYSRMQISSDEDFIFFWSALGPMMTDGFRVWRVADHVDWSWLDADQSKCIVTNFTNEQRIEVELRSEIATVNDVAFVFQYDPNNLMKIQGGIRLKVLGPHPRKLADTTEVRFSDKTKGLLAVDSRTSNGKSYHLYVSDTGTDAISEADFNWATGRIGVKGREIAFDKLIVNVDETGTRTRAIGDTTLTPDIPLDKDPLEISETGQTIEINWNDDVVTFFMIQDDESEQDANPSNETVSFTTTKRVINAATLYFGGSEEVDD